ETIDMGGGSARVNPPYQRSVAEGLTALLGDAVTVTDGVEVRTRPVPARPDFVADPAGGAPGVHATLFADDGSVIEERQALSGATVVGFDDDFDTRVAAVTLRARIDATGAVEVGAIGVGSWTMGVAGRRWDFDLHASGEGLGEEILAPPTRTERVHLPAGAVLEATVTLERPAPGRPMAGVGSFGLVARPAPRDPEAAIADAFRAAADADVAVVVVGLTEEQETEAVDKTTLRLPGRQDDLVRAVAAAARRTVVVVNAATPVLMPWRDDVDAVLWAGLPGQEGGHAVAAALLGDIEPAGRLVTTFPVADAATPAWSVTPVDGRLEYAEGTFIGYRGHDAGRAPAPAFWFGHGLGYATWEYADARVLPDGDGDGGPTVRVTVTNTGDRDSREVVQVYLRPAEADQPVRLVGWRAAPAAAGESVTVDVPTDDRMWRRWDTRAGRWSRLAPGGHLLVARGLGDVRAELPLA
ncbi:MAG TPA: glycoside hydrolase family 3 C-terminal domain-containing protein, partial [Micromonosporaceae bacterium]|nr:glycoside hydrolase family 3 C-terminal domain-containing protein [Micromonosporaceae bacterium]